VSFPKRKLPAALAWLACGLYRRTADRLRSFRPGHSLNAPAVKRGGQEPMFLSQHERRP
jgi:hypothetical protein